MGYHMNGKAILIQALVDREGYTVRGATKLVRAVINVMKEQLVKGKNVEIDGLGVLTIIERTQRRKIERNLKHTGPTVLTINKQKKTVALRKYKEKKWPVAV